MEPIGTPDRGEISRLDYNPDTRDEQYGIEFCHGQVVYTNNTVVRVTFVFYECFQTAQTAFYDCARLRDDDDDGDGDGDGDGGDDDDGGGGDDDDAYASLMNNDGANLKDNEGSGVIRSWSFSQDASTGCYLVSYDRFQGFLTEHDVFKARSDSIPGNPDTWVQYVVKELIGAVMYIHSKNLTCRIFDEPKAYVLSGGKIKVFLGLDARLDLNREPPDSREFILEQSIFLFGEMLRRFILVDDDQDGPDGWIHRDSFLRCFDYAYNSSRRAYMSKPYRPEARLEMIRTHPFLASKLRKILKIVWLADRGLRNNELQGYDMVSIRDVLENEVGLFETICPDGNWELGLSLEFKNYIYRRMEIEPNSRVYGRSLINLITWNRNAFQHNELSEDHIYLEACNSWPNLYSELHQIMCLYKL